MSKKVLRISIVFIAGLLFVIGSCTHQPYILPDDKRVTAAGICFERDILPVFQSNCAKSKCHDAGSHREGYALNSYEGIVKKGIVPGNPEASEIFLAMTIYTGEEFMPQDAPPLSASQLATIKAWIAAGALKGGSCAVTSCDSTNVTYATTIAPIIQTYCVGCHNSSGASGGSLATYSDVKDAALNGRLMGAIQHLAGYSAMPQGGSMLDACQLGQFRRWVAAGAPQN